uniref:Cornifelin n=1 Tax=Oncorhynchus kisutch TaxID=8019 RepID=A0A8C7J0I0_ONCKI
MAANMTVHQQVAAPSMKGWKTGLFDSFQDMSICCNEFWCCPCYASSTTGEFGESTYLPLMDIIGPAFMAAIGVPVIVPPASLSMRVAVRHKYGIQGSLFEDILVSCFCACCSWCQMAREIKEHKKGCTFTTTQPVSIQVQPPTMTTSNVSYTTNQQSYTMTSPQSPNQQGYIITGPQSPHQQGYVITGPHGHMKTASDQHAIAGLSQMTTSDPPAYNPAVMMLPDMSNHMVNTTVSTKPSKC